VHETCEARGRNKARDLQWARTALEGALQDPPAEWDPPLEPHTIFGGYELLEELGRGATGIVYRCRPLGGTQTVAIKLMLGSDFASEAELQRFRLAQRLQRSWTTRTSCRSCTWTSMKGDRSSRCGSWKGEASRSRYGA
jgi:serine/threonine protein kinase